MLQTLKKLGKEHGLSSVSVTTKTNGKPGTRELKLSSVDRLWENIHKDPGARLVLADYLDENGEPELAKFMRGDLKLHTTENTYRPDSMGIVRGKGNYQGYDIQHPHIYRFMGHDGTHTAFLKTKHMGDKEYLSASHNMPHGDVERLAKELDEGYGKKMELAAQVPVVTSAAPVTGKAKAPAGGMVSNNQFYEGGKFLPQALKAIREVRNRKLAGKVKLSRNAVHTLLHDWQPYSDSDIRHLVAADALEESHSPATPLAEFLRNAKPGVPEVYGFKNHPAYARAIQTRRAPAVFRESSKPFTARRLKSLEDPSMGISRVYFHHLPEGLPVGYHGEGNQGHIIVRMQTGHNDEGKYPTRAYTWHAPATKEQLQALGAKSKRMKLNKLMSPE